MTRRVSRDIYRVAEVGGIHRGRQSERIVGASALARRERGSASRWTHPMVGVVLAVVTALGIAWSGS